MKGYIQNENVFIGSQIVAHNLPKLFHIIKHNPQWPIESRSVIDNNAFALA